MKARNVCRTKKSRYNKKRPSCSFVSRIICHVSTLRSSPVHVLNCTSPFILDILNNDRDWIPKEIVKLLIAAKMEMGEFMKGLGTKLDKLQARMTTAQGTSSFHMRVSSLSLTTIQYSGINHPSKQQGLLVQSAQ